jgi:hypothetical protein
MIANKVSVVLNGMSDVGPLQDGTAENAQLQTEPGPDAVEELAERGARRAVS